LRPNTEGTEKGLKEKIPISSVAKVIEPSPWADGEEIDPTDPLSSRFSVIVDGKKYDLEGAGYRETTEWIADIKFVQKSRVELGEPAAAVRALKKVTVVKTEGKKVGLKLKANPTGAGPIVDSVSAGGLAIGKLAAGDVLVSINGKDVAGMVVKDVTAIIMASTTLNFAVVPNTAGIGVAGGASVKSAPNSGGKASTKAPAKQALVGKRVTVDGYEGLGTVRFAGKHHESGAARYGVEMDNPVGLNNGSVKGHVYFTCKPKYGVLSTVAKVKRAASDSAFTIGGPGAQIELSEGAKPIGTLAALGVMRKVAAGALQGGYNSERVYTFDNNDQIFCIANKKTGDILICDRMRKETRTGRTYVWSMPPDHPVNGTFETAAAAQTVVYGMNTASGIKASQKLSFTAVAVADDDDVPMIAASGRTVELSSNGTTTLGFKLNAPANSTTGPSIKAVCAGHPAEGKMFVGEIITEINGTATAGQDMKEVGKLLGADQKVWLTMGDDSASAPSQASAPAPVSASVAGQGLPAEHRAELDGPDDGPRHGSVVGDGGEGNTASKPTLPTLTKQKGVKLGFNINENPNGPGVRVRSSPLRSNQPLLKNGWEWNLLHGFRVGLVLTSASNSCFQTVFCT
jgi:hypothetical protein